MKIPMVVVVVGGGGDGALIINDTIDLINAYLSICLRLSS